jgi:hypothetical protein
MEACMGIQLTMYIVCYKIRVVTKLPNSEQSYKGKVKTTKNVALGVNVSKSPQNTTQKSKDLETRTQLTPGNISVVSEG